jgi:hypothetical protein
MTATTVTADDMDATLARAYARPTRGGYTELDEPPTPPLAPLVLVEDGPDHNGPLDVPAHLLAVCKDYQGLQSAVSALTTATGARRAFGAQVAWWCARAYLEQRDKEGRDRVLGELCHTLQKGDRQVRRFIRMGRVFGPADMNPELSQAVHLVAARANDPARALAKAADNSWNAGQLLHYLTEHTPPPVKEHPVHERYDDARMLEDALALVRKAWRDAEGRGGALEWQVDLRVTYKGKA